MKNLYEGVDRSLRINQSGLDRVEIDEMMRRLQQLSIIDRLGLLDSETEKSLETVSV